MTTILYLLARLREPSTWAAIASAGAALGLSVPGPTWQIVVASGTGLAALLGFLLPEVTVQTPAPSIEQHPG